MPAIGCQDSVSRPDSSSGWGGGVSFFTVTCEEPLWNLGERNSQEQGGFDCTPRYDKTAERGWGGGVGAGSLHSTLRSPARSLDERDEVGHRKMALMKVMVQVCQCFSFI